MKKQNNNKTPGLATKSDLKKIEKSLRIELLQLEEKMEGMEERIDENARKYRDKILTGLDGVMGELQTMREENTVGTHQTFELRTQVENHEKRIARLEKSTTSA